MTAIAVEPLATTMTTSNNRNVGYVSFAVYGYHKLVVPSDFDTLGSCHMWVAGFNLTGAHTYELHSAYGVDGDLEQQNTEDDVTGSVDFASTGVPEKIDVSGVLTGITANSQVAINYKNTRSGSIVHCYGLIMEYTAVGGSTKRSVQMHNRFATLIGVGSDYDRRSEQMLGSGLSYLSFIVPPGFTTLEKCSVWIRKNSGGAGSQSFTFEIKYGTDGESWENHTETITPSKTLVTGNVLHELDISSGLTGITAGDLVSIKMTNTSAVTTYQIGGILEYS